MTASLTMSSRTQFHGLRFGCNSEAIKTFARTFSNHVNQPHVQPFHCWIDTTFKASWAPISRRSLLKSDFSSTSGNFLFKTTAAATTTLFYRKPLICLMWSENRVTDIACTWTWDDYNEKRIEQLVCSMLITAELIAILSLLHPRTRQVQSTDSPPSRQASPFEFQDDMRMSYRFAWGFMMSQLE